MTPTDFKEARRKLGLSQSALADRLGVQSGRTIRRWEHGERDIPGPAVVAVELLLWLSDHGFADPTVSRSSRS